MENEGNVKENGNKIIRWGKIFVCIAVWTVVVGGGCFILGRITYASKALVVDTIGRVEKCEIPAWKPTTNTGECCRERNEILADYYDFLSTPPRVLSVTDTEIRFAIRSNEYALTFHLPREVKWRIAPIVSGRLRGTETGIFASLGAGAMVDNGSFGGGVMVNGIFPMREVDVAVFLYARI